MSTYDAAQQKYHRNLEDQLASLTIDDLNNHRYDDVDGGEFESSQFKEGDDVKTFILSKLSSSSPVADVGVRYHAIEAAGRLGISDSCDEIIQSLILTTDRDDQPMNQQNNNIDAANTACCCVVQKKSPPIIDNDIRIAACKAARKLVESGNWCLSSSKHDVTTSCEVLLDVVLKLSKFHSNDEARRLLLLGGSARVRIAAIKTIGTIFERMKKIKKPPGKNNKRGKRNTNEENDSVEVRAAKAIAKYRLADVDSDADVRIATIKALGKLGSKSKKVVRKYVKRLQLECDDNDNDRDDAYHCLGKALSMLNDEEEEDDDEASRSSEGEAAITRKEEDDAKTYDECIRQAKKRLRPRVTSWNNRYNNAESSGMAYMNPNDVRDNLERIDYESITTDDWINKGYYNRPQVVKGIASHWKAKEWTEELIVEKWGEQAFRVGSDENDNDVRLSLGKFVQYLNNDCEGDDNPMYLFDHIGEGPMEEFLDYYSIPKYFTPPHDLFSVLDPIEERPPHRWIIYGGKRSGSPIHKDPLCTSAWNTSLFGSKRWMLFPPETGKIHLLPASNERLWPVRAAGPSAWFEEMLPKI